MVQQLTSINSISILKWFRAKKKRKMKLFLLTTPSLSPTIHLLYFCIEFSNSKLRYSLPKVFTSKFHCSDIEGKKTLLSECSDFLITTLIQINFEYINLSWEILHRRMRDESWVRDKGRVLNHFKFELNWIDIELTRHMVL